MTGGTLCSDIISDNIEIIALWIKNRRRRKFVLYIIFSVLCLTHLLFILKCRVGIWGIFESVVQTTAVVVWSIIAVCNIYGYCTFKNWSVKKAYYCDVIAKSRTKVEIKSRVRFDTGYYLYVNIDGNPVRTSCEPEMYWTARKNDNILVIDIGDGNLYSMYKNKDVLN